MADQPPTDGGGRARAPELQDVLNDVVAERVLREHQSVLRHARDESLSLRGAREVEAALQDTAAVPVRRDVDDRLAQRVVHEGCVGRVEALQDPLHDVVAVQVAHERHDVRPQRGHGQLDLPARA